MTPDIDEIGHTLGKNSKKTLRRKEQHICMLHQKRSAKFFSVTGFTNNSANLAGLRYILCSAAFQKNGFLLPYKAAC
jgi:hypothetical protein